MTLTPLPLELPGKVYRSPMPMSAFDKDKDLLDQYKQQDINVVVVLASDREVYVRTGIDLRETYQEAGYQVLHFPIKDFAVPEEEGEIKQVLNDAMACAQTGLNVVMHCFAGRGRSGMLAALLARRALGLSGEEAVNWVREHIPGAIETTEQEKYVLDYEETGMGDKG